MQELRVFKEYHRGYEVSTEQSNRKHICSPLGAESADLKFGSSAFVETRDAQLGALAHIILARLNDSRRMRNRIRNKLLKGMQNNCI